jgi:hypothetical protein
MQRYARHACGLAIAAAALLASPPAALACACCAETAWRYDQTETLKPRHSAEIGQMRFAKEAKLRVGSGEDNSRMKELKEAGENLQLEASRPKERMAFTFRDEKGRTGTLSFQLPNTIAILEVDPRGAQTDTGLGPTLYKEWKLNAHAAGDGLFKAAVTRNTRITLVLHGRGNACTSADQFTDWTLLVSGPPGKFTLYGKLEAVGR